MNSLFQRFVPCLMAPLLLAASGPAVWAEGEPSREAAGGRASSEESVRLNEARMALDLALARNELLGKRVKALETKNRGLAESLAAANAESIQFGNDYRQLRLRLEALGAGILKKDPRGLDKRLLAAVNDLRISEQANESLRGRIVRLSEVVMGFMKSAESADTEARARVESELRAADTSLTAGGGESLLMRDRRAVEQARIISVKSDLGLIVIDSGDSTGMRVGMPLSIFRKDKPVAAALVVDVRGGISGAVVTDRIDASEESAVRIGDLARVETLNPLNN